MSDYESDPFETEPLLPPETPAARHEPSVSEPPVYDAFAEPEPSFLPPEPEGEEPRASALSYEAASARIEEIIRRLDSGEAGLRETLDLCREGRELVELCAAELEAVGQGLEELRLDELVARLEAGRGTPS
jgi:exodeoxyribonuclease VII small subunit